MAFFVLTLTYHFLLVPVFHSLFLHCSLQCVQRGYKQRVREKGDELIKSEGLLRPIVALEGQDYLTFFMYIGMYFWSLFRNYEEICYTFRLSDKG